MKKREYLKHLEAMMTDPEFSKNARVSLTKLYAQVGGFRRNPRKRTLVPRNKPKPEPTMEEVILQLEREHKNG